MKNLFDYMHKEKIKTIACYAFVGITTPLLYLSLFWVFIRFTESLDWLASSIAYTLAVIYQFYMHSLYTFKTEAGINESKKFVIVVATGAIFSYLLMHYFAQWVNQASFVSAVVIVVITPIFNFILFSNWVFTKGEK